MALQTLRFGSDPQLTKASENNPPLKMGAKGEGVAILRPTLVDLGFAMPRSMGSGSDLPDGIFGSETLRTVSAFQKAQGLIQDGSAGRQTLKRLEGTSHCRCTAGRREACFGDARAAGPTTDEYLNSGNTPVTAQEHYVIRDIKRANVGSRSAMDLTCAHEDTSNNYINLVFTAGHPPPSSGHPLHGSIRAFMQSRFGVDLGNVRIHTGRWAVDAARRLGARAFYTRQGHLSLGPDSTPRRSQVAGGYSRMSWYTCCNNGTGHGTA